VDARHSEVPRNVWRRGRSTGVDNDFMKRGFAGIGAWILGRNMFGPDRGPWANDAWRGWWGENLPITPKSS
jgi:hypothetical protein